jgi:hypothetical protein
MIRDAPGFSVDDWRRLVVLTERDLEANGDPLTGQPGAA